MTSAQCAYARSSNTRSDNDCGAVSVIDDWAGRGGLGSRLLQYHHVAAIVFGGDWEDPDLRDSAEIDAYFMEQLKKFQAKYPQFVKEVRGAGLIIGIIGGAFDILRGIYRLFARGIGANPAYTR